MIYVSWNSHVLFIIGARQEHENRFTFMMGMYLAFTVLFTADSPLGVIGAWFPGLSYFVVFAAGYFNIYILHPYYFTIGNSFRIPAAPSHIPNELYRSRLRSSAHIEFLVFAYRYS